ncbi:hypothetical protein Tco_0906720 [Tanacetum coccineum]|uniref:Integrase, catalytic region, zinc finger, CCHC-type, peptidase aspartic, catalytic n=1 Tax=Tanacetum coccineum TaxID=301880 RepID=A0ABQ5CHA5_9ASTR
MSHSNISYPREDSVCDHSEEIDILLVHRWNLIPPGVDDAVSEDDVNEFLVLSIDLTKDNLNSGIKLSLPTLVWICQILQEISQKRTRERMSDQEAKEIKAEAREIMPQPSTLALAEESQQAAVQNSNSSAQQDAIILSVIEQLKSQSVEIDRLKQTLSEHLKEKESLMQTVTLLKNNFKKEESRNIDREIALEKKIKQLDNIKSQQLEPKLYDGNIIKNTSAIVIPDFEETLMLAEESRSKMLLKQQDLMVLENKVITRPVDYVNSMNYSDPNSSCRPTKVKVLKELSKVNMVNTSLKKLKHHLAGFDVVVKERTTATTITEGSALEAVDSFYPPPTISRSVNSDADTDMLSIKNSRGTAFVCSISGLITVSLSDIDSSGLDTHTHIDRREYVRWIEKWTDQALRDAGEKWTHSKLNANSELLCVKCNGCMLSDNHDLCVLNFINDVNARAKSKSVKITTTAKVLLRKPTAQESVTPKPVVTLVYSRKPRKSKTNVPVSKPKIIKSISSNKKEPSKSWGSIVFDVPSSSLDKFKFKNDHMAKILGYGDYQIGNATISRVYYVEGLGHNLFFVGQLCDSKLEVAFHQHTCFIRNLEGVDLLTGS